MVARSRHATLGSIVFFALAPGVVAGLVPWWLTRWEWATPLPHWNVLRALGVALLAGGSIALVHAFVAFVAEGAGTPAPVAPTRRLVVGGLYRHVRNPMYIAVVGAVVGQALLLGRLVLLAHAAAIAAAMAAFARWYEEPALRQRFGNEYEVYRRAVPAWRPRRTPWRADGCTRP
jgi:protein-S-isoprenylcysteine O-methyltransferase Ste14